MCPTWTTTVGVDDTRASDGSNDDVLMERRLGGMAGVHQGLSIVRGGAGWFRWIWVGTGCRSPTRRTPELIGLENYGPNQGSTSYKCQNNQVQIFGAEMKFRIGDALTIS